MQVKVYREPENEHLILDENALAEYHRLTEELGIPAVKPEKVPNVYQPLNNAQVRILTALCPASVKIPDPMIIGKGYQSEEDRNKGYSWRMHHTLIARWGDCAYEFVDLLELGRKRVMQNLLIDAKELKQLVDMFLAEPEVHVEKFIQTGTTIYKK